MQTIDRRCESVVSSSEVFFFFFLYCYTGVRKSFFFILETVFVCMHIFYYRKIKRKINAKVKTFREIIHRRFTHSLNTLYNSRVTRNACNKCAASVASKRRSKDIEKYIYIFASQQIPFSTKNGSLFARHRIVDGLRLLKKKKKEIFLLPFFTLSFKLQKKIIHADLSVAMVFCCFFFPF
ncbi:hypothetical protein PUN28_015700 [Cardiocondyla obscurior]|uniref:Uncharacterized protein n=1 Tax=Cardiocondyla obscurior TaxID=286306 RepID=A0AAW2EW28_9HYME